MANSPAYVMCTCGGRCPSLIYNIDRYLLPSDCQTVEQTPILELQTHLPLLSEGSLLHSSPSLDNLAGL